MIKEAVKSDKPATITVRKMPFEFDGKLSAHWNRDKPEWSHMVNGASLAMPFLEPYLIRTMKKALPLIKNETLREDVRLYIGQEGQHFQQHRRFNDKLIEAGYEELIDIERKMADEFAAFERDRSLKFNVAYACGFETMALVMGHWLVRDRKYLFAGSDTRVASLVLWHFVEEIEHKSVAFDVYQTLYGNGWLRAYGTFFATLHVMKHSRRAYQAMLKRDGLWRNWLSRWRLLKMICRLFANLLPGMVWSCLPSHHPTDVDDPQWCLDWIKTFENNPDGPTRLNTANLG